MEHRGILVARALRWTILLAAVSLTIGLLLGATGTRASAVTASRITISPTVPVRGATFSVRGTLRTKVRRPVIVQYRASGKWRMLAASKTNAKGRYRIAATTGKSRLTVRVVAKAATIRHHHYRKLITKSKTFTTRDAITTAPKPTPSPTPSPPPPTLPPTSGDPVIGTTSLPMTTVTLSYHAQLSVTDGEAPFTWSASGLPPGLSLDASTGEITGNATASGVFDVSLTATDQLGRPANASLPLRVGAESQRYAAGLFHTCAVTTTGAVRCWGNNSAGEIGDGTKTNRNTPTAVVGLDSGVIAVTAGYEFNCALRTDGSVACWGAGGFGQLGNGDGLDHTTPTSLDGLGPMISITAGSQHACSVSDAGAVYCWGWNHAGELGNGTTDSATSPVGVTGIPDPVTEVKADYANTCAVTSAHSLYCWGANDVGQLGGGTTGSPETTPVAVPALAGIASHVVVGGNFGCASTTVGAVLCWGNNDYGQLGDQTTTGHSTPAAVTDVTSGVVGIAGSTYDACALDDGGSVRCWGWNDHGQLGDGTQTNSPTPVAVNGLASNQSAVAVGRAHTCAVDTSHVMRCWGANFNGQLGDATWNRQLAPVEIQGLG